jgi:anthranilate phosphoribosyltransferase
MLRAAIMKAVDGKDLTEEEAAGVMKEIMSGNATQAQVGALLTALRIKGETGEEILGFARVMRDMATPVPHKSVELVDVVGTGGDHAGTFNISTTSAFVVAGAGGRVAKHGNRAVTSKSGAADVLVALGVKIDISPEAVGRCIDEVGIGFLFANSLHLSMKHAAGPRKEIGIRTVFNLLGPLTNPAGASCQLVGVFDADYAEKLAWVLGKLGSRKAKVAAGLDGLDEITLADETRIAEYAGGKVRSITISPEDFGLKRCQPSELLGGSPEENAAITLEILAGQKGPHRDIVLLNAGATLEAAGLAGSIADGMALAAKSIDTGAAQAKLASMKALTNQL